MPSTRHGVVAGGELGLRAPDALPGFSVTAGARAELAWSDLVARDVAPGAARVAQQEEDADASVRVAVRYADGGLELHGAFVRSLRFPSLFELFGNTGAVRGNPALVPESSLGGELGARWTGAAGPVRLSVDGQLHLTRATDLILLVASGQDVARAENVPGAWLYGAELALTASWRDHLVATLGGTWLEAVNASDEPSRDGRTLPGRARFAGTARVEGCWAPGHAECAADAAVAVRLWSALEVLGASPLDYANTTWADTRVWWSAGAGADLLGRRLRLSVDVRNLLGDTTQDVIGYPLPGVTALGTVAWVM